MIEDAVRKWNPWWASTEHINSLTGVKRDITGDIAKKDSLHQIKDLIGVRRSGKTTIMYQLIKNFIERGIKAKNIVLLNFDDPEISSSSFDVILNAIEKINPDIEYLFLDEIQQKAEWEKWTRMLYDTKRFKRIFVTGSSASLLSQDAGRVLTGRHLTFSVFPFSFREYLMFFGWENFDKDFLEHNKNRVMHYLESYIKYGGFPETLGKNEFESKAILTQMYNDILSRDISSRFNVSFETSKKISYFLLSNIAKEFSYRNIAGTLNISVETAEKYLNHLTEAFVFIVLDCFSFKIPVQFKQNKKIYCIDTGLKNAVSFKISEDRGRLCENIVLIELKRKGKEVYYWKDEKKREIDFLTRDGTEITSLIQVCIDISNEKTRKREIDSLMEGMKQFKLSNGLVITENYEGEEKINGKKISYAPLWRWLLNI